MDKLSVREAKIKDAAVLAEISALSIHPAWSKESFTEAIESANSKVIICQMGSRQIGYVVCYHAADEAELASIAVLEEFRRRKAAGHMLSQLWDELNSEGVNKLFLEVREGNVAAQKLYESAGLLRVGVRKDFYDNPREDAYIMALTSAPDTE